ncbi:MAG: hypothetical protein F6K50_02710 [Moorea sp. SIO3I7]|uniref:phage tail tube protein n=1 Tax=Moorena sp. SIO3I8 TaxID=2607833 RepID=UPI0013BF5BDC|nr:hypothetical protein [Moorena sp. SIO3I8]NEN94473.1 hypothetical protein [Moorena sp. SIO3I7]NEO04919.1 hypothetical protein [Moorena sp. SIO3I8]
MPRPFGETQLKNTTLEVLLLPYRSRTVTEQTITLAADAATGATSISATAEASTTIKAGTGLSFSGNDRRHVLVIEDATVATTATDITISPAIADISTASTATFITGLVPLFGIQEFNYATQPQEVDTTNLQSGSGMESVLVRSDRTYDVSGITIPGDEALFKIIKPVAEDDALFGREVYFVCTTPDGEVRRGAAKVKNFSESGNQNEVKRYSFQLQVQGSSFVRISPHIMSA